MSMADPFLNPAFSAASLTQAINLLPAVPMKLDEMGLMPERGVRQRTIIVEERAGVLNLLQTQPVGSPGTPAKTEKRTVRSFVIPHIPHDDAVFPADVDGLRAFGQESGQHPLAQLVNDRQVSMRKKHDVTLEHLRMGALKGIILDADGTTLYNLFTEFGITSTTSYSDQRTNHNKRLQLDFVLGTAATNILGKCNSIARHIEANMSGESFNGIMALVRSSFFDSLGNHANVKAGYERWMDGAALRGDYRRGFSFGPVTFVEYEGAVTDAAGTVRPMVPSGEGIAFPIGTLDTFASYFCPADFNEAVGTIGQRMYSKIEARPMGRGWDLHTQSNPLPMCHRPSVLVRIHTSN